MTIKMIMYLYILCTLFCVIAVARNIVCVEFLLVHTDHYCIITEIIFALKTNLYSSQGAKISVFVFSANWVQRFRHKK